MSLLSQRRRLAPLDRTADCALGRRATDLTNDRAFDSRRFATPRILVTTCLAVVALGALAQTCRAEPMRVDVLGSEKKSYPEIEEGRRKLAKMDVEGARLSFEAAAKAHPELPSGRAILGNILIKNGRVREGRAQLEKAINESPTDPEPYLIFGELAFSEGRPTDSALLYDKALALAQAFKGDTTRKTDYMKRALTGAAIGAEVREQWEVAQKYLSELLKIDSQMGVAHFRLGRVKFELKQPKDAFASLSVAAKLDEKIPSPEVTMAKFCYAAKEREEADEWLQKAITRLPKDAKTRLEVGQVYLESGRVKEALEQAVEAAKLTPDSQEALFLAGVASRFNKDYANSVSYLEKAYLKAPGNMSVSNQLALAEVEMGEGPTRHALALAESAMKQNPNNAEIASTLGWVYFKLGRLDEADRLLRAAVSSPNLQPDTAYFYAKLQDARNRGDTLKPLLEWALRSEQPFAYRDEAQKLADQFGKRPVASASTDAPPAKTATPKPASKGPAEAPKNPPSKAPAKASPPAKAPAPKQ